MKWFLTINHAVSDYLAHKCFIILKELFSYVYLIPAKGFFNVSNRFTRDIPRTRIA